MIVLNASYFENVRYFALARQALLAAFKMLDLKTGDQVLLPSFICREVLAPLHAMGLEPVYYEVSKSLCPLDLPRLPRIRVVLAVNYFGFKQDLGIFRKYCDEASIYLIEDNAHGFLSVDDSGIPLGLRGDIGIFSIRKTFSIPDGAMLKVNNHSLLKKLPSQIPFVITLPSLSNQIKSIVIKIEKKVGFPLLWQSRRVARIFRKIFLGQAIVKSNDDSEFVMSAEVAPFSYSMSALQRQDLLFEANRRRDLYKLFDTKLKALDIEPVFKNLPERTVPYGYIFYADTINASKVIEIASRYNFDCYQWPELPAEIQTKAPLYYWSLWVINFIC